jgi:hypothetical protein
MKKELKFICAQPDDSYYTWQVHLWLESLRKLGHSDKAIVLLYVPDFREQNTKWTQVINLYPEAEFVFYKDIDKVSQLLRIYIPIIRPYVLMRYFKEHPEMKDDAVFYCDSDIVFTENFNINKYVDDDVCYLSDTNSYINASYFDSKTKDVLPEKLEEYKQRDILQETTSLAGVSREIAEANNLHSGGAQYFLKNIDSEFWNDVMTSCLNIRTHLQNVNKEFFESENKGFQSWCSDMWAVLYSLWKRKQVTRVVKEMDFAWSSDNISRLSTTGILHNAGITDPQMGGAYPAFYKGTYHTGKDLFDDPHLQDVLNNETSQKHCTYYYLQQLLELKKKYNLKY